jgi:uncharacterized protein YbaP (TraB family)
MELGTSTGAAFLCLLVCSWSSAVSAAQSPLGGDQSSRNSTQEIEEILVVGERPGPRLWKISWADHVLWILGTLGPLPKQMAWRSSEVEAVIGDSSEVLGPFSVALSVEQADPFRSKTRTLKAALPAGDYARWLKMQAEYIDRNVNTDNLLPTAAALLLQAAVYEKAGLTYTNELWGTIYRLAEENGVPVRSLEVVSDWEAEKGHSRHSSRGGINYLEETMSRVKTNERTARARANAWAVGDVAALKELTRTDDSDTMQLALSWPFLSTQEANDIMAHAQRMLARQLDYALRRNQVSFAAIPIFLLFREHGLVADLRLNGLSVDEPH